MGEKVLRLLIFFFFLFLMRLYRVQGGKAYHVSVIMAAVCMFGCAVRACVRDAGGVVGNTRRYADAEGGTVYVRLAL